MMMAESLPNGVTERLACKVLNLCRNTVRSARQRLNFIGPRELPFALQKRRQATQGLGRERTAASSRDTERRELLQSATDAGLSQPASTRPISVLGEHPASLATQTKPAGRATRSARTTIESDAASVGHSAQSGLDVGYCQITDAQAR